MPYNSHSFFAFWRPFQTPAVPQSTQDLLIVPLKQHLASVSFPELVPAITCFDSGYLPAALAFKSQLELLLNQQLRPYALCSSLFIFMIFVAIGVGIALYFSYGLMNFYAISGILLWIRLTRLVKNSFVITCRQLGPGVKAEVAAMRRRMLRNMRIRVGDGLGWLSVSSTGDYHPPGEYHVLGAVPLGLAV